MESYMKKTIITIITTVWLLIPMHVFADSTIYSFTDNELIKIIKSEGYSAVSKARDGLIKIKIEGRTILLYNNYGGDLQAFYAISGTNLSYEDINEWNKTKRLSRAYLDSDKDPAIESDLLSDGGITKKNVVYFFNIFTTSVSSFRKFIIEHNKS